MWPKDIMGQKHGRYQVPPTFSLPPLMAFSPLHSSITPLHRTSSAAIPLCILEPDAVVSPTNTPSPTDQCHWAALNGNSTTTWSDAHLTPTGIAQALAASRFWSHQLRTQKQPPPQSHYVSPLDRALHTAQLTFSTPNSTSTSLQAMILFNPTVKELLRETNGIHTCDRRSSRTHIATHYPAPLYTIEAGFTEDDELWRPDARESDSALTARLGLLLDDIFTHDDKTWVSMTSHGGAIAAILRVVGHRPFALRTGSVMPVVVKAVRVRGDKPKVDIEPWTPRKECS